MVNIVMTIYKVILVVTYLFPNLVQTKTLTLSNLLRLNSYFFGVSNKSLL